MNATQQMLHDYYERPELWDPTIYTTGYEKTRLTTAVDFVPGDATSLLDVGCGNGAFLSVLETRRPEIDAYGVDPSRTAVKRRWCRSPIAIGDMNALPFADRSFDVVSSMAVLEHIPVGLLAYGIAELARVARKYILIDLPYRERRTRIRCPQCGCGFDPHLHLRSYMHSDIVTLFPRFDIEKHQILTGSEALVPHIFLRLLRREVSAANFANAVCPQCGHRSTARATNQPAAAHKTLWRRLWESQPQLSVEREIFVLFKRP